MEKTFEIMKLVHWIGFAKWELLNDNNCLARADIQAAIDIADQLKDRTLRHLTESLLSGCQTTRDIRSLLKECDNIITQADRLLGRG